MSAPQASLSHAIVLGGSVAGLLAARVLAEHFDRVTVLERDVLRDDDEPRRGVPQGRHVHALLIRGHQIIEALLPGYTDWAVQQGAEVANMGEDCAWHLFGGWRPRYTSQLATLAASRPLLERGVRRFVMAHPRVQFRGGCEVSALLADEPRARVLGVRFHEEAAGPDAPALELRADLVVDATGRGSRTPRLLEALGLPTPEEIVISSGAAYATRVFKLAPAERSWRMCYVQPSGGTTRGGIVAPIEGGRHIVTLIGMAGDAPPTTEDGFRAFAESLPVPEIAQAMRTATPLSPIYGFARAENRRRRYDTLPRHLDGLLVTGDAQMALNPVYGQGITAAAIGAETLGQIISEAKTATGLPVTGLSARFQRRLSDALATPWQMASGEDLRWLAARDASTLPLPARLLNGFVDAIQRGSLRSPQLTEAFYRVAQLLDGPAALFRPSVLWGLITSGRGSVGENAPSTREGLTAAAS